MHGHFAMFAQGIPATIIFWYMVTNRSEGLMFFSLPRSSLNLDANEVQCTPVPSASIAAPNMLSRHCIRQSMDRLDIYNWSYHSRLQPHQTGRRQYDHDFMSMQGSTPMCKRLLSTWPDHATQACSLKQCIAMVQPITPTTVSALNVLFDRALLQ
jgi:hypothetical protein